MRWHYTYCHFRLRKIHKFDSCYLVQLFEMVAKFAVLLQWNDKLFFFQVDFGEVFIPPGLDVPRPRVLPEFKRLAHGLRSSNISVLDAKTFYIPNLHYDGAGPDAYFWLVHKYFKIHNKFFKHEFSGSATGRHQTSWV